MASSAGVAPMDIVESTAGGAAAAAPAATAAAAGATSGDDVPRSIGESTMSIDAPSSAQAAPMDQEPEEAESTVSLVAGRAKRKRKSTVMTVDGQAVLKLNNCACTLRPSRSSLPVVMFWKEWLCVLL